MDRNQVRQVVTAQFYQSLAENKAQVQSIPQTELQAIVNALADGVFAALAAVEQEGDAVQQSASSTTSSTPEEERLIWRGRPYLSIGTAYELTTQRLRIIHGFIGHSIDEIELVRVHDTKVKQHMGERALNIGDITIFADDSTTPIVVLNNISDPVEVREMLRKAVIEERQRRGLTYREIMR